MTSEKAPELKPCPFCGGDAVEDTNERRTMIECLAHSCVGPHVSYVMRDDAIAALKKEPEA